MRLHFFSPTCPHCQAAKPFLDEMATRKPWLEIKRYPGRTIVTTHDSISIRRKRWASRRFRSLASCSAGRS